MGRLPQLAVILWKSLYVQKVKRHYLITAAELLLALLAFFAVESDRPLPFADAARRPPYLAPASVYNATTIDNLPKPKMLLYSPDNNSTVRSLVQSAFQPYPTLQLLGYPSRTAMAKAFRQLAPKPDRGPDQTVLTLHVKVTPNKATLEYIIGFYDNGDFLSRRYKSYPIFDPLPDAVTQRRSVALCQIALGQAFAAAIRADRKSNASLYEVVSQRMPQGPHPWDVESRRSWMVVRLGLAFVLPFSVLIAGMVKETETGMKERLRLMGMRDSVYWLGHFITALVVGMSDSVLIVTYMSTWPQTERGISQTFLDGTSSSLVLFCFFLFCAQYAALAMVLSLFFTSAAAAVVFGLFFWVTSYCVPFYSLEDLNGYSAYYLFLRRDSKQISSYFPCMAVHWCFRIIGCANLVGEEYGWRSVTRPVIELDNVSMLDIWTSMLTATLISFLLVWYLANVLPWAKGVPRPPWFFLKFQYWFPAKVGTYEEIEPKRPDGVRFEEDPPDREPAVFVNRLAVERTQIYILHEMTFKAFPGEITAILAPSGAGKTALTRAISGLVLPTSGQIIVGGFDMTAETRSARKELGVCQKKDVLFDDLTGYETLVFFGVMRNVTGERLHNRIKEIQDMLGITPTMSMKIASEMAGTQHRLFNIAAAILAAPRVVLLDEPTWGLDALSRANFWNTMTKIKEAGPTSIIMTTTDILETEHFADRIAILGYGALKCHGSRNFVKRRFGCGFNVRLTKIRRAFLPRSCIECVREHVPDANVVTDHKEAMIIGLGETTEPTAMSRAMHALEHDFSSLGIASVCLFTTTMEDVFIRLVLDLEDKPIRSTLKRTSRRTSMMTAGEDLELSGEGVMIPTEKVGGVTGSEFYESEGDIRAHVKELCTLKPGQPRSSQVFKALIAKRLYYTKQTWALPLFCWLLPTAVLFSMCHIEKAFHDFRNPAVLIFPDTLVYDLEAVHSSADVFLAYDKGGRALAHAYYMPLALQHSAHMFLLDEVDAYLESLSEQRYIRPSRRDFVLGAYFAGDNKPQKSVVAFYNGDCYHTEALSLNLVNTALLRHVSSEPNATITAVLRPTRTNLSLHESIRIADINRTKILSRITTDRAVRFMIIPIATATLLASFVFFPIDERVSRGKTMQMLSGVSPVAYWATNYAWDIVAALISLLCMFFPIFLCHPKAVYLVGHIVLLTLAYVHCTVPLVYLFSFVTDSMAVGFLVVTALLSLSGVSTTMGYQLLLAQSEQGEALFRPVSRGATLWMLYVVPPFTYHWALVKVVQLSTENTLCSESTATELNDMCAYIQGSKGEAAALLTGMRYCCADFFRNNMTYLSTLGMLSFHRDSAAVETLIMIVEGVILMALLVSYERGIIQPLVGARSGTTPPEQLPPDVAAEKRLVEKAVAQRDFSRAALVVHNIQKIRGHRLVLRGVSFQVQPGECFVVVGLKGCGKAALIDILAGTVQPSAGTANMPNATLTDLEAWQQKIGVCPQYDGILGKLTVRQTLWFYANLRGIKPERVDELLSHVIDLLNLRQFDDWFVSDCNASSRRKLAVGIAIIGLPPLVLFDDPGSGLDFFSKKKIYDAIRLIRELVQSTVVIATHSMSDGISISDRMAILTGGQFDAIGTVRDVRARLAKGCLLSVRFMPQQLANPTFMSYINQTVNSWFPGATLSARVQDMILEYRIEVKVPWSNLLKSVGDMKEQLQAQEVLVGEVTLEHVMLRAARRNRRTPDLIV